jgi:lipid II:glycine glycyltransferase (peptidoglycan interpeptide bridge formation enzyme)
MLRASGGHLLQSWRWGSFKEQFGWVAERIAVEGASGPALAQVLFRGRFGVTLGYIPRGPVGSGDDPHAISALWAKIDRTARRRRALAVIVEPDLNSGEEPSRVRLDPGPPPIQPARTVKVILLDDDSLMKQMHPKMRYNVRLAKRRGVETRASDDLGAADLLYGLLEDTAQRNGFIIHQREYYRQFLQHFSGDTTVLVAEVEGRPVAAAVPVVFGDEAIYMYGASSTQERGHGAAFLLQFEAMRWARERGCTRYDLWGIPEQDPVTSRHEEGDRLVGTSGGDRRGLYEFKTRFGGEIVSYPPPLERRYIPYIPVLARRFYSVGG